MNLKGITFQGNLMIVDDKVYPLRFDIPGKYIERMFPLCGNCGLIAIRPSTHDCTQGTRAIWKSLGLGG